MGVLIGQHGHAHNDDQAKQNGQGGGTFRTECNRLWRGLLLRSEHDFHRSVWWTSVYISLFIEVDATCIPNISNTRSNGGKKSTAK